MILHRKFFYLTLLFLPSQLGFHFWPDWAMVLGRRVDYLSPTIYFTDILLLLTVGFFFVYKVQSLKFKVQSYKKSFLFLIPIVLFVVLNIVAASNHFVAIYKWAKALGFVLLGWYIVKSKIQLSAISLLLSAGVLYASAIAISQFVLQHSVGGPLWFLGERTFDINTPGIARFDSCQLSAVSCQLFLRAYATFPHPNVLGGFLAATLPLLIFNLKFEIFNQIKKFSIFKATTITLGLIALFLTFSRSAIVIGMIAIAWLVIKNKKLLVIIVLFILIFTFRLSPIASNDESVVVRQQLNEAAIKIWKQSPLVGVGLGNFLVELPKALPSRAVYFLQPVHNIYLLILAETGVVGLVFSILFFLKVFKRPFDIWHLVFIILLVLGLVDHYFLTLQQGQLLLTIILSLNLLRSKRIIGK